MPDSLSLSPLTPLAKVPSGIQGLDTITAGGLPYGRSTLVCGSTGCGKTLLAMQFLVHGILEQNEPGLFVSFEETPAELARNVASLGFDLEALIRQGMLVIEQIYLDRLEIEEIGSYTLDGLFIRIGYALDRIGARRVAIDTIEMLFSSLSDETVVRGELRRLFRWLKEREVTAVVTAERAEQSLTRYGMEEYVADCVILLDHRVHAQIATRRLRILKYRGSTHGTSEYPFLIDERGLTVFPITALELNYSVSNERISSGITWLDALLGGEGYYRGSTVLLSGEAGTGKSSFAAAAVARAIERGEQTLFIAFEEAPRQIVRNLASLGIDLSPGLTTGRLHFHTLRPTLAGLELHLALIIDQIMRRQPTLVVVDPITSLISQGAESEVRAMLMRLIDLCKQHTITLLLTSLSATLPDFDRNEVSIASLVDTWLLVRNQELNNERHRELTILKSRGMAHSNQVCSFFLASSGISLGVSHE